jgi:hypothetical protein
MSEWLDLELSHHLARTDAPPELWSRVCTAHAPRHSTHFVALPVAAVVTLVLAGALYFIARGAPPPPPNRAGYTATLHTDCLSCHATI